MALTEQQVLDAVKPVQDPELHLGIVDLGLIYGIDLQPAKDGSDGQDVKLTMTFTTPFCPYGPALKSQVHKAIAALTGVTDAQVAVVFTPVWDPHTMASEDAKIALGLGWAEEELGGPNDEMESQR